MKKNKPVLILGNGISRLLFKEEIKKWRGELWACNLAYIEYGDKMTRWTGHQSFFMDAYYYRKDRGLTYELWTNPGVIKTSIKWYHPTIPYQFIKDSGTTLVAQGLYENRDVICCGFDMGGADIHSPKHWKQDKSIWLKNWKNILDYFDAYDQLIFWGYDHKQMIREPHKYDEYQKLYKGGVAHFDYPGYADLLRSFIEDDR